MAWAAWWAVAGVVAALVLGAFGGIAIYNTKDGQLQGGERQELTFPETPTAMLAAVDRSGDLASVTVFAVRPTQDGEARGGTVVPVPVSADATGGFGDDRAPLAETAALFGIDTVVEEVPVLLGVSLDATVVVDESDLVDLLAPLGEIDVTLPVAVVGRRGVEVAPAGRQSMNAVTMAKVLTAVDADTPGTTRVLAQVAVWQGIADAVGVGLASPLTLSSDGGVTPTTTDARLDVGAGSSVSVGELITRLTAGPMGVRALRSFGAAALDVNPRGVDAVVLDRVDVATVFGHVAPGRVSAPNPGYNFQVRSRYDDGQLPDDLTRNDIAYAATKALLATDANVIAVDTSIDSAESATIVEVTDETLMASAERLNDVFGPVEVRVVDRPIAGVDVIITLGTDYGDHLEASVVTSAPVTTTGDGSTSSVSPATGTAT
ncbi:hypothetical protein BH24ACT5_BH24ACT5_23850 [soil metagenome]